MKSEYRLSNNDYKMVFRAFSRAFPQASKVWGTRWDEISLNFYRSKGTPKLAALRIAGQQLPKFNKLVFGSHKIGCVVRPDRLRLSPSGL